MAVRGVRPAVWLPALLALSVAGFVSSCSVVATINAPTPSSTAASSTATVAAGTDPALERFYGQVLSWQSCDGDFQCATLTVPLSYDNPSGPTLGVEVIRLPASNGDARIGSLVLNPGGPGGSGLDYARAARAVTSEALRERYDIVGFDPRGVGASNPIRCLDDLQTDAFISADASPDTPAEVADLDRLSAELGTACQQRSPDLLAHVGTLDVARDLDVLRAALGDDHLQYLGKSYGTDIGVTYAELFPTGVGRMVLDGAIDASLDGTELSLGQAEGFERALRRFAEMCPTIDGCPLAANPDVAMSEVRDFLSDLDANPLPGVGDRRLTESRAVLGIIGSLYDSDSGWPVLSEGLARAFEGDGAPLLEIGDRYTDRDSSGHYLSNANDAIYAVNCWDKPATPGTAATAKLADDWAAKFPTFGRYLAWGNLPCATWPGHSSVTSQAATAEGSPPILVVGTVNDPATPVEWARSLARQLSRGVYLEWTGDGHTAYQRGSACIDEKVDAYLIEGTAPATGTICD